MLEKLGAGAVHSDLHRFGSCAMIFVVSACGFFSLGTVQLWVLRFVIFS